MTKFFLLFPGQCPFVIPLHQVGKAGLLCPWKSLQTQDKSALFIRGMFQKARGQLTLLPGRQLLDSRHCFS